MVDWRYPDNAPDLCLSDLVFFGHKEEAGRTIIIAEALLLDLTQTEPLAREFHATVSVEIDGVVDAALWTQGARPLEGDWCICEEGEAPGVVRLFFKDANHLIEIAATRVDVTLLEHNPLGIEGAKLTWGEFWAETRRRLL